MAVDGRDFGFMGLEIAVRTCRVEHRRNKKLMVVSARKQSRERREVAQPPVFVSDDKHPEHLAAVGVGAQTAVTLDVALHLTRRQEAQGVRLVVEGVGEFSRFRQRGFEGVEGCHLVSWG